MQEPLFSEELASRTKAGVSPLPPLAKNLLKKKVTNFFAVGLKRSAIIHALCLVVFLLSALIERIAGNDAATEAKLRAQREVRSAIRVDMVDLPKLKLTDLQNVDLTKEVDSNAGAEKKPEEAAPSPTAMIDKTKTPPKEDPKKVAKDSESGKKAHDRIKELQERMRGEQRRREMIAKLKAGKSGEGRQALGGNIVSEGYSTSGDVATDVDVYNGKARAHVQRHWNVPGWMQASKLRARILVKIAPDGRVVSKDFLTRSGNVEFDHYVDRSIEMADPFPAPPETLKRTYMEDGVEWGFPN